MKIPGSIRALHVAQFEMCVRLQDHVDGQILQLKDSRWHYESRIKSMESYAQKLETGLVPEPEALEDFFACTLVVANSADLSHAERLLLGRFALLYRRPDDQRRTEKPAHDFRFDDTRLYVKVGTDPRVQPRNIDDVVFEIQLKTYLQHAWAIATHDLTYKTASPKWSTARIAYQIKAMLEHAELSIQEATQLSDSSLVNREDARTSQVRECAEVLRTFWDDDDLPKDVLRLSRTVVDLFAALRLPLSRLDEVLISLRQRLAGTLPLNLSPYSSIIQSLLFAEEECLRAYLYGEPSAFKLLLHAELELPPELVATGCVNAVFVP